MSDIVKQPNKNISLFIQEVLTSARFLVDSGGGKTDVVLSFPIWKQFLSLLEEWEERDSIEEWLPKLKSGPLASGALRWDEVKDEWDDDEEV